jgi:hypothetical protein
MDEHTRVLFVNLFNAYADFYEACLDYLEDVL